jgi:endonuclease G, mitochondrial
MAVFKELVETARRFRHWRQVQADVSRQGEPADQAMKAQRRRYSALQHLHADPGVFLEAVIEGTDLMPVRYFEMGLLASRPIGRIHFDLGPRVGQGYATGFLVAPGLLLTNQHVLPSPDVARVASVTFDAEDGLDGLPKPPQTFPLEPGRLYLADAELDFCFVAVAGTSTQGKALSAYGYLRLHAGTGKILRDEYATIIQHPRGRQKQVAARNNRIEVYVYDQELPPDQAAENNHLYYTTDTLAGSSGAPVFSDQWYVIALHRRGVPKTRRSGERELVLRHDNTVAQQGDSDASIQFVANEGVRVSRIRRQLEVIGRNAPAGRKEAALKVLEKVEATLADPQAGPFSVPTAAINRLSDSGIGQAAEGALEVVRRSLAVYADAPGFDENFLGVPVRLPALSAEMQRAAARRIDEPGNILLPFRHFTSVVHAGRRLPIYAAANIDGAAFSPARKPARPQWSYDPRLDETQQPDDSIFSTLVQRGHMAAREFMWWGDEDEAREADLHSFTLSNVCPQINRFNGSLEWFKLERLIAGTARNKQRRVNCFMGPVFARNDRLYDDLRGEGSEAAFDTGIRMPRRFWYVLAWLEGRTLKRRCFILDQSDDIEAAGELEFDFAAPATVREVAIAEVSRLAKLRFPDLD